MPSFTEEPGADEADTEAKTGPVLVVPTTRKKEAEDNVEEVVVVGPPKLIPLELLEPSPVNRDGQGS